MRVGLVLGSVLLLPAGLLVAGCNNDVRHLGGPAAPVSASPSVAAPVVSRVPSAPPSSVASSRGTEPTPATSRTVAVPRLGPAGLGPLKLGMTHQQASATGLIRAWEVTGTEGCNRITRLKAAGEGEGYVYSSVEGGVQAINAYPGLRTPEGIRIGSTRAAVIAAYPGAKLHRADAPGPDGRYYTDVPGNSRASYRIAVDDGKVSDLTLQLHTVNCYE